MKLRLRFFGRLTEIMSPEPQDFELAGAADLMGLKAALLARHPGLGNALERCMIAVNTEFAAPDQVLADGDEVAFLPPVSGG
ncbi:MAG: MoaD/ThiS family protein [Planctomycetes bacterium]|nr:MoaD/ThiS family protein [Planctomycetota bacterium]